jgi:ABC-type nitrate/sulfonate/bicarbonate transport system ATPase subunit
LHSFSQQAALPLVTELFTPQHPSHVHRRTRRQPVRELSIRILFQEALLPPWRTVLRNVQLGLTTPDAAVRSRVALARALEHRPRLLLVEDGGVTLDETVALARPRAHGSPAFAELEGCVLARVLNEPLPGSAEPRDSRLAA